MTEIIIIAALAKNNVIGKNNDIPWRIKEDFQHFKDITMGWPCIMGDKTFLSLPDNSRPLPGRENIVCTLDMDFKADGAKVFHDFNLAIDYVKKTDVNKAFVIGGATIYRLGMKVADTLELTRIDKNFEGDVYFPDINFDEWLLVHKEDKTDPKHGQFSFLTYGRKK